MLEAVADRGQVGAGIPSVVEEGGARARCIETHCRCKVIWICGYFQQLQTPKAAPKEQPQGKSLRLLLHSVGLQGSTSLKPAAAMEAEAPRRMQSLSCLSRFRRRGTEIADVVRRCENCMCLKSGTVAGTDGSRMSL